MANKTIKDDATDIKETLAQYLGVEPEDINYEDSLVEDLHMRVTDLTDFVEHLKKKSIAMHEIDLTQIETVGELIEALTE